MKKLIATLSFFLLNTAFTQELPYTVSYQENGSVINHATCRLAVINNNLDYEKRDYLNQEFINLLSLKGYRIYQKVSDNYKMLNIKYRKSDDNTLALNDFVLKMNTHSNGKKHFHEGELALVTTGLDIVSLNEFSKYTSGSFRMSPNRVHIAVSGDLRYEGSPMTIDSTKGRKALFEVYNALPNCISSDSGHHYEKGKYNEEIVKGEIGSCIGLYQQDIRRLSKSGTSLGLMFSNFAGYGLTAAGLTIAPLALPVGGGVLGYNFFKKIDRKVQKKHLQESIRFMSGVEACYASFKTKKRCSELSEYVSNKNNKKRIKKYLELMSSEELTQKIADYLGSTRACSLNAKKIKKLNLKHMLKDVEKTI